MLFMHLFSQFIKNCTSSGLVKLNIGELKDIFNIAGFMMDSYKGKESFIKNSLSHNHSVTRTANSVISNKFAVSFIYTKAKAIH